MGEQERHRQEDGEPSPQRRQKEDWAVRSWVLVRGGMVATSVVLDATQHETLTAVAVRVLVVIGDTTVKIWQERNRR